MNKLGTKNSVRRFKLDDKFNRYVHLMAFSALVSFGLLFDQSKPSFQKDSATPSAIVSSDSNLKPLFERISGLTESFSRGLAMEVFENSYGFEIHINTGKVFFPGDSTFVDGQEEEITKFLKALSLESQNVFIEVEGHTDASRITRNRWKYPSNWELSSARAGRLAGMLRDMGLPETHLKISGRGPGASKAVKLRGLASASDFERSILDRRTVIYVTEYQD